jgi:uncharacterized repeat protein (TIGR01451 family)/LPXTG-motif cell wall-anchored protein
MKNLRVLTGYLPKRVSAFVAMIAAAVIVPAALLAWGPDRPTFTIEHPADHITFNSITNNPDYGDERNFVRIKDAANTAAGGWSDEINVQPGKEYLVQMYVHNNAATSLNLVAKNTNVKANVPTTTGKKVQIDGFISADNASPKQVWDQAIFNSTQDFNVAYVPGSAVYYNNVFPTGTGLADSIVTNAGVKVGYDKMDGNVPGCFQYSGYVSFKVKPQFAAKADFTANKMVSKHGVNKWVDNYSAQPGETVDYLIEYKNTGKVQEDNVMLLDKLPAGMTYVSGSTMYGNSKTPNGTKASDNITTKGINVGSYAPGANAWAIFSAKAPTEDKLAACGANILKNVAKVETDYGTKEDSADITLNKKCTTPSYTCNALTVTQASRTSFKFDTKYSVQNATYKSTTYVVRDAAGKEIYRGPNATYNQEKAGKYTIEAIVTVTVNGTDKTATSANCKKPFEVVEKTNPCPLEGKQNLPANSPDCKGELTPPTETPTELPHTGASDNILALIGAGSLIAASFYYVASRRNS